MGGCFISPALNELKAEGDSSRGPKSDADITAERKRRGAPEHQADGVRD